MCSYKNFNGDDEQEEHARRTEYRALLSAPPRATSLVSHVVDLPADVCPREGDLRTRRQVADEHGTYHSLDIADGLPFSPSAPMPHGAALARKRSDQETDGILSKGWSHVKSNLHGLKRSLSLSSQTERSNEGNRRSSALLADIPEVFE